MAPSGSSLPGRSWRCSARTSSRAGQVPRKIDSPFNPQPLAYENTSAARPPLPSSMVLIVVSRTAPQDRSGLCTPHTTRHSKEEPDGPVAPGPRTYVTEPGMLSTEHLYDIVMDADVQDVGVTPSGHRRFVHVTGGTFEGPRMRGTVLPGGGDWLVGRADGSRRLDV